MKKISAILLALSLVLGANSALAVTNDVTQAAQSDYEYSAYQLEALTYLNGIREKMGLQKVKLNPYISKAAVNHANYVVNNKTASTGLGAHNETEGMPGFTGVKSTDRVKAVGGSLSVSEVISYSGKGAAGAIDSWLSTAYHRSPLTDPNADEFGIGINGNTAVLNMSTKKGNKEVSVYPYDGQTNVDTGFYGLEIPNPLEQFDINSSGYIISFQPPFYVQDLKATITDSRGQKVPFYYENDAGCWFFFPSYKLSYDEKYTVSVDYTANGVKQNKSWSFRTTNEMKEPARGYLINGIKINGKAIPELFVPPMIRNDSVLVPVRGIFERLNAKVSWDDATRSITIKKQDTTVQLTVDSDKAYVNGKEITLEQGPIIFVGSAFVPLRFISETIGAEVGWDNDNRIASIDVELGEPEDPMVEILTKRAAEQAAKKDAEKAEIMPKVNLVTEISKKYGYTVKEGEYGYGDYVVKDMNGLEFARYTQYTKNNRVTATYYVSNFLPVPQMDMSLFLYLQEVVEAISDTKVPNLANTLMQSFNDLPKPTAGNVRKNVEINPSVKLSINFGFHGLRTDGSGIYKSVDGLMSFVVSKP